MSAAQRRKGAGGERELCALLSDHLGEKISRRLGQARDSGHDVDLPPFRIECKRRKRFAGLYEWIKQADHTAQFCKPFVEGERALSTPVLALRADGKDWLVVMRLPDWLQLAREEIAKP